LIHIHFRTLFQKANVASRATWQRYSTAGNSCQLYIVVPPRPFSVSGSRPVSEQIAIDGFLQYKLLQVFYWKQPRHQHSTGNLGCCPWTRRLILGLVSVMTPG